MSGNSSDMQFRLQHALAQTAEECRAIGDPLYCICCGRLVDNAYAERDVRGEATSIHPAKAVEFTSPGHYGSTAFDPMDGSNLHIVICDPCIESARDHDAIYISTVSRPRTILWERL